MLDDEALMWWYALIEYGLWYAAVTLVYALVVWFWPKLYKFLSGVLGGRK